MASKSLLLGTLPVHVGSAGSCISVSGTPMAIPWKYYLSRYSSKQTKLSDIIRWNAENKALFGAKVKKRHGVHLSEGDIKARKGTNTATSKLGIEKLTGGMKHRLEEMHMLSVPESSDRVSSAQINDRKEDPAGTLTNGSSQKMVHKHMNMYAEERNKRKTGKGRLFALHQIQSENCDDFVKVMPIPEGKKGTTDAEQLKVLMMPSEESNVASLSQEADFVHKCPLFPDHSYEMSASAHNFHSMVESLELRFLPTVNTILTKTRPDVSNFFLQRWRNKMKKELGEAGFKKHQEGIIWQGTNLHACIQQYLSGSSLADIQVQDNILGHWTSVSTTLSDLSDVKAVETSIFHPLLLYKGTVDCVAKYKNVLCVIDWKTSSKPRPLLSNLYDNPLQVIAYLGAINSSADFTAKFGVIDHAAIVVVYPNGETAHVHRLPPALCQHYWGQWCHRLHLYWTMIASKKKV